MNVPQCNIHLKKEKEKELLHPPPTRNTIRQTLKFSFQIILQGIKHDLPDIVIIPSIQMAGHVIGTKILHPDIIDGSAFGHFGGAGDEGCRGRGDQLVIPRGDDSDGVAGLDDGGSVVGELEHCAALCVALPRRRWSGKVITSRTNGAKDGVEEGSVQGGIDVIHEADQIIEAGTMSGRGDGDGALDDTADEGGMEFPHIQRLKSTFGLAD